jgi:hypothetical protein
VRSNVLREVGLTDHLEAPPAVEVLKASRLEMTGNDLSIEPAARVLIHSRNLLECIGQKRSTALVSWTAAISSCPREAIGPVGARHESGNNAGTDRGLGETAPYLDGGISLHEPGIRDSSSCAARYASRGAVEDVTEDDGLSGTNVPVGVRGRECSQPWCPLIGEDTRSRGCFSPRGQFTYCVVAVTSPTLVPLLLGNRVFGESGTLGCPSQVVGREPRAAPDVMHVHSRADATTRFAEVAMSAHVDDRAGRRVVQERRQM